MPLHYPKLESEKYLEDAMVEEFRRNRLENAKAQWNQILWTLSAGVIASAAAVLYLRFDEWFPAFQLFLASVR